MSELNIFFHAIQNAFNTAVQAAVAEATAPLIQRIAALENNPAVGVDTTLEARVKALESAAAEGEERIREIANSEAEAVLFDHKSTYDHDAFDDLVGTWGDVSPDGFVDRDNLDETVRDLLDNATVSFRL
jgi:hypothetical protein